jgi:acyl carrier protein
MNKNEKIIEYIRDEISNQPIDDIDIDEDLLGSGIVDSLGMMKLVIFLENEFDIKIGPEDMTVENFMTIRNIAKYISKQLVR